MKRSDLFNLCLLGALWGTSFLFMRIAAPESGPAALSEVRVAIAALCLLPAMRVRGRIEVLRKNWICVGMIGVVNTVLPFALLAFSMLYLGSGQAAVINSRSPLFTGLVVCTASAYILYFLLIESAGATRAVTVTFLVPVFAALRGKLFLGETLTARMTFGSVVILGGLSLAAGLVQPRHLRALAHKSNRPRKPAYTPRPGRANPSTSS